MAQAGGADGTVVPQPAHPVPEPSTEDRPSEIPVSASPGEFIFTGGGWGFPGFISGLIVPI